MSDIELCFRKALQEERFHLATVLLPQVVEAHCGQLLPTIQLMHLQQACRALMEQHKCSGADVLLQAALAYVQPMVASSEQLEQV